MSHTFNRQFVHIVFGTKDLQPLIHKDSQSDLGGYMTGIVKELGGFLIARAGTTNHVHLLVIQPTDFSIPEMLRRIKANSTPWYRRNYERSFLGWEEGYGAFSVSPEAIENVKKYFLGEHQRHNTITMSYENELMSFLKFHEIQFKPEYVGKTTYTSLNVHLVWGVKNRDGLIRHSSKPILHDRIAVEMGKIGGKMHAIGSVEDHVHVFVGYPKNMKVADIVKKLKTVTSPLIRKLQKMRQQDFEWQEGYGVFSVGKPAMDVVANYVRNQERHHYQQKLTLMQEWDSIVAGKYAW